MGLFQCVCLTAKGNSCLNPTEMGQLVVLRMNRGFMAYMRKIHGPHVKLEDFPELDDLGADVTINSMDISADEFKSATLVPVHI